MLKVALDAIDLQIQQLDCIGYFSRNAARYPHRERAEALPFNRIPSNLDDFSKNLDVVR